MRLYGGAKVKVRNSVFLGNVLNGVYITSYDGTVAGNDLSQLDLGRSASPGRNQIQAMLGANPDLAGLCVSHAARGDERRQYDAEVPPAVDGIAEPRLWRDGELVLAWKLSWRDGSRGLVDSPPYDEAPWRGGFFRWADERLDPDAAEAAIVLRRACEIGMGRGMDLEAVDSAAELGPMMGAVCYTMQPTVMPVAFRNRGSIRDFGRHPDALLQDQ
jgi:hypothetical protein